MIDEIKNLGMQAAIVAVLGGVISYILAMVTSPIVGFNALMGPLIGGLLAVVILLYIAKNTNIDAMTFFNLIVLLVFVSVIGTFIVGAIPQATGYILTLSGSMSISTWAWSLVYVGLAMLAWEYIDDKFL